MNRVYLLSFDGFADDKEALLHFLDGRAEINDLHTSMSSAIFLATELNVIQLRDLLQQGPVDGYIVVEIHPGEYDKSIGGRLPRATWEFIERKAVAG